MNTTAKTSKPTASKPTADKSTRTSAVEAVTADKPTTASKPTESKPTETTAAKVSRSAPLDLTALSVEAAPAPKMKGHANAGRKKADNSVAEGWLRGSWAVRENGAKMGAGKAVTVPTNAVGTLRSRLNTAAETLSLGVAIQTTDNPDGTTRVVFAAKVRKVRKVKPTTAETNADAPAAAGK